MGELLSTKFANVKSFMGMRGHMTGKRIPTFEHFVAFDTFQWIRNVNVPVTMFLQFLLAV